MDQQPTTRIPIASIILDEDIYPRKGVDHRRVGMFAENIRDGFLFDPVEVEAVPDTPGAVSFACLTGPTDGALIRQRGRRRSRLSS